MVARPFVTKEKAAAERVEGNIKEGDDYLPKISEEDVGVEGTISLTCFSIVPKNVRDWAAPTG